MNKKISIIAGILALAGVIGLAAYQSSAETNLLFQPTDSGETENLEISEKDTAEQGVNTADRIENEDNKTNASEIEKSEEKTKKTVTNANEFAVTRDEVRTQLTDEYPGIVTEFELEREDGRWLYEVEIHGADTEYEIKLDAETGKVIKFEQGRDSGRKYEVLSKGSLITMSEAEEIALNEFSGMIKEVELERDDGRIIYEIEIKDGNNEAEFDIDAADGEIIKQEFEYED